jgi:hypothetical protein
MTVAALAAVAAFGLVYNLVAMRRAAPPDKRANATDGQENAADEHTGKGNPSPAPQATEEAAVNEEEAPAATVFDLLLRSPAFYGVMAAALVILFANLEGVLEMRRPMASAAQLL